jgi:hypothetical protein
MYTLGIIMIIYGAFILAGFILQFPFLYNNIKSKALIKMMGKTGYNILLIMMGVGFLVGGILLIS